jgi:hemolysin A
MKTKRGTAGIDDLNGTRLADQILGLDGADIISGKGGNDKLRGGEGSDEIRGGGGGDKLFGDGDDDFLFGDSGSDVISGGDGNDIIIGGSGNDILKGGDGNDRLFSNTGNDRMNGGEGDDYYEIGRGTVETIDDFGNDEYKITADSSVKIDDQDGVDKLRFADTEKSLTITMNFLMFQRSGDDLVITVDGYKGETTITFFYAEENYRIERIYDEDPDHATGYNLEIKNILNLSNGDEPIRGIDLWEL